MKIDIVWKNTTYLILSLLSLKLIQKVAAFYVFYLPLSKSHIINFMYL